MTKPRDGFNSTNDKLQSIAPPSEVGAVTPQYNITNGSHPSVGRVK